MKKSLLFISVVIVSVVMLGCSNDIVRERVVEIDDKYDVICVQGPISNNVKSEEAICNEDKQVVLAFKQLLNGMEIKKFPLESDLIEFSKTVAKEGSYMFSLLNSSKPNGLTYHITAYSDGQFQFPELGTTEMRYVSKEKHIAKFKEVEQFVQQQLLP